MAGRLISTNTAGAQYRARYDATNYADFTVGSTGDLTIAPSGGDTSITGRLAVSGNVTVGGLTLDGTNRVLSSSTNLFLQSGGVSGDAMLFRHGTKEIGRAQFEILAWGTTVTTGAAAGDVVLANAGSLRGARPSGTGTLPMVSLNADEHVVLAGGSNTVMIPYRAPYTAAVAHNGTAMVDSATVGRFVFYAGGLRYYVTGTSF